MKTLLSLMKLSEKGSFLEEFPGAPFMFTILLLRKRDATNDAAETTEPNRLLKNGSSTSLQSLVCFFQFISPF